MRSFLILVSTFVVVYFATPWLMYVLMRWVHLGYPEEVQSGIMILASIGVYSCLRRRFGDRLPHV